jgi:predicted dinucleotide-binding enzyme
VSERDFAEFIRILNRHRVRFLIVGAYALAHHGYPRATNDVDVLIATDDANRKRVRAAAIEFVGLAPSDAALRPPRGMFRIGPDSAHVDVTTKIDGVGDFERAYRAR